MKLPADEIHPVSTHCVTYSSSRFPSAGSLTGTIVIDATASRSLS